MHASLLLCAYITVSVSHASLFIIQMLHCSEGKQAKYASSVTTNKLTLFNKMYEYTDCCECQCNVYWQNMNSKYFWCIVNGWSPFKFIKITWGHMASVRVTSYWSSALYPAVLWLWYVQHITYIGPQWPIITSITKCDYNCPGRSRYKCWNTLRIKRKAWR